MDNEYRAFMPLCLGMTFSFYKRQATMKYDNDQCLRFFKILFANALNKGLVDLCE